jgi:hypothetical protein
MAAIPQHKLRRQFPIALAGFSPRWRHNQQISLGIALKLQVRVGDAQFYQLCIAHSQGWLELNGMSRHRRIQ